MNKTRIVKFWLAGMCLLFTFCAFSYAEDSELEFTVDINSPTVPLPDIYKPNMDLSGRGVTGLDWPQSLASRDVLESWQKDVGFSGIYRVQYNLWEINQAAKAKGGQEKILADYDNIINNISSSGGIVILDIFGTPAGMGRVLDKKSAPADLRAFKKLIKETIRDLSCNKKYNIWYEVWNAPDLDDFFLGRQQEYFNLYRAAAEAVQELEQETGRNIPIGGPSTSWWFQSQDSNTILTPERSLVYGLIRYCYSYRLPLDFISWHGYSTDPLAEQENTIYHKYTAPLIRDWLTYFHFDRNTPLIIDEWNFDSDSNVLTERREDSYIAASFIPARIKGIFDSGINNQVYFALEDFQNQPEAVVRNVGVFSFDPAHPENKSQPKAIYNVFRMLAALGKEMFITQLDDEFVRALATRSADTISLLIYNYIDPQEARSYLSKNIGNLSGSERKMLVNIIKTDKLGQIMAGSIDTATLHLTKRVAELLKSARRLNDKAKKWSSEARSIKINIKNLKDNYAYQLYSVDSTCKKGCEFNTREEKEVIPGDYHETLSISPYSVNLIVLKVKPREPEQPAVTSAATPVMTPAEKKEEKK